MTDVVTST